MAGDRGDEVPVRQDVSPDGDAYAPGRHLQALQVQVPVFGSSGVQAGERGTQVNFFLGGDAGGASARPAGEGRRRQGLIDLVADAARHQPDFAHAEIRRVDDDGTAYLLATIEVRAGQRVLGTVLQPIGVRPRSVGK